MQELDQKNFSQISKKNAVIEAWAVWCGPCRVYAPILEKVSAKHKSIEWGKVNVDEQQEIAAQFGIMSIPTTLFFKNGKIAAQEVGVMSEDRLEKRIKEIYG